MEGDDCAVGVTDKVDVGELVRVLSSDADRFNRVRHGPSLVQSEGACVFPDGIHGLSKGFTGPGLPTEGESGALVGERGVDRDGVVGEARKQTPRVSCRSTSEDGCLICEALECVFHGGG